MGMPVTGGAQKHAFVYFWRSSTMGMPVTGGARKHAFSEAFRGRSEDVQATLRGRLEDVQRRSGASERP